MNLGILITSHPGHAPYLEKCLSWLREVDCPVVFGWDGMAGEAGRALMKLRFLVEMVCTNARLGLQEGEKWQILNGLLALEQKECDCVFKTAGDIRIRHPGRIGELAGRLGDSDMLSYSKKLNSSRIQTMLFVAKIRPLVRLLEAHKFRADPKAWAGKGDRWYLEYGLWLLKDRLNFAYEADREFWVERLGFEHHYVHS